MHKTSSHNASAASLSIGSRHLTGPAGTLDDVGSAYISAGAYTGPGPVVTPVVTPVTPVVTPAAKPSPRSAASPLPIQAHR